MVFSCAIYSTAEASKLTVSNQNDKDLTVYIQAEGSVSEDLHWMEITIPAKATTDINVTAKDMGGKATYFIRGRTNPLTPRGTCSNMSVDKDYKVTFKNLNIGTECTCELANDQKEKVSEEKK